MHAPAKRIHVSARWRRCIGQASFEYTIVVMLVVLVLVTTNDLGEEGPIHTVVQVLKDLFNAYSWALSFSSNVMVF